jgi:hypothetical protein
MESFQTPSVREWSLYIVFLVLGVFILGTQVFSFLYGTTPEDEFSCVEGLPSDVELIQSRNAWGPTGEVLQFTVGGYRTEYPSGHPKYQEVVEAVTSGDPVQVWVSTRQETVFPRKGWVPLYKLNAGIRSILTYPEVTSHQSEGGPVGLILGGLFFGGGAWGLYSSFRKRREALALLDRLRNPEHIEEKENNP